jgi:uncharacterized protein
MVKIGRIAPSFRDGFHYNEAMTRHVMIVPSLACPAGCSYCFGPHKGRGRMGMRDLEATAGWLAAQTERERLEVTFHGGEPLLAGAGFYRQALPRLRDAWDGGGVNFTIQSNLWRLDDALLDVFAQYPVSIGTSLDGPETINDAQRGAGYFRRTMAGIEKAREQGIPVGCIATFTAQSAQRWREVVDFFMSEGLSFSVHAALPVLGRPDGQPWALPPDAYAGLIEELLDFYIGNLPRMRVDTLDAMIRSVSSGKGGICTFGDCLGRYLAVGPGGEVYPCQRFAGSTEYCLGSVAEPPDRLKETATWKSFESRQQHISDECSGCEFLDICRGGCPYNTLAVGMEGFRGGLRDPYCAAYRRIFTRITELAAKEMFSEGNLSEVVERPDGKPGLLRQGRVLELMIRKTHPYETAQNARQALAVVALAATDSPREAVCKLQAAGLVSQPERAERALSGLQTRLHPCASHITLNNLYLHVTYACSLRCTHCYAEGGDARLGAMRVEDVLRVGEEAARAGFRHLVVTGGEPLAHPKAADLLSGLADARGRMRPLRTVLRTNLVQPMDADLLQCVAESTDEVVVSLDGGPSEHDARRGKGSYARTLANLRRLVEMGGRAEVSLASVLPLEQMQGEAGRSVKAVAKDLGIRRVRFRPLLPLGRAAQGMPDLPPEAVWASLSADERVAYGFTPSASCGMGQNLYVEPDGSAYPCYAWHGESWRLGNVLSQGVGEVIGGEGFARLGKATVDTNQACRRCVLRYLCGGACRAWNRQPQEEQTDLDTPPTDCSRLHERARALLLSALRQLEVPLERWLAAGLPVPDGPPGTS